jgi:uncharacterized membrane protein
MTGGWGELALALLVFVGAHLGPTRPRARRRLTAQLGERGYLLLYSVLSVGLLAWLIVAAGRAPFVPLWDPAPWQAWVALVLMAPACLLVAFGLGAPNPFSIGGGDPARFDPARPGIVAISRHPILWAVALWAGAHLLANGDLAHALLFGSFLGMAALGIGVLDRRARRRLGDAAWAMLATRRRPGWRPLEGGLRLAAAAALYLALLHLHAPVIGVDPMAWL